MVENTTTIGNKKHYIWISLLLSLVSILGLLHLYPKEGQKKDDPEIENNAEENSGDAEKQREKQGLKEPAPTQASQWKDRAWTQTSQLGEWILRRRYEDPKKELGEDKVFLIGLGVEGFIIMAPLGVCYVIDMAWKKKVYRGKAVDVIADLPFYSGVKNAEAKAEKVVQVLERSPGFYELTKGKLKEKGHETAMELDIIAHLCGNLATDLEDGNVDDGNIALAKKMLGQIASINGVDIADLTAEQVAVGIKVLYVISYYLNRNVADLKVGDVSFENFVATEQNLNFIVSVTEGVETIADLTYQQVAEGVRLEHVVRIAKAVESRPYAKFLKEILDIVVKKTAVESIDKVLQASGEKEADSVTFEELKKLLKVIEVIEGVETIADLTYQQIEGTLATLFYFKTMLESRYGQIDLDDRNFTVLLECLKNLVTGCNLQKVSELGGVPPFWPELFIIATAIRDSCQLEEVETAAQKINQGFTPEVNEEIKKLKEGSRETLMEKLLEVSKKIGPILLHFCRKK